MMISHKGTKTRRERHRRQILHGFVTSRGNSETIDMNEELEQIAKGVVDASMKLDMALGPSLLESVYTLILQKKLQERGYQADREVPIPVEYQGLQFELGFRADLIINGCFYPNISDAINRYVFAPNLDSFCPISAETRGIWLHLVGRSWRVM